jgi:ribonucleotide reductase alpha subunit
MPYESADALKLNTDIFETIYHASMETSMEIAKVEGAYSSFKGYLRRDLPSLKVNSNLIYGTLSLAADTTGTAYVRK